MTPRTKAHLGAYRYAALACVIGLVIAAGLWVVAARDGATRLTAYFATAVGVYAGSTVRILGIDVGRIDTVVPEGGGVRVDMTVDPDVRIPADARAVVIAPSLVSDRYVQLTPVYTGGPELASGTVLPRERTGTPVEIDDLYRTLDKVSIALGPDGANRDGALSDALKTGAENLDGNGKLLNDTLRDLGDASNTLSGAKGDLFATVDGLQKFTTTLARSDDQIHQFNTAMAEVTDFLAADSHDLGLALEGLAVSLAEVHGFIQQNRTTLKSTVDRLASVTGVLVDQRAALAEVLDIAPVAASNLLGTYDAASGTLHARAALNELSNPPALMVCRLLRQSQPRQVPKALGDLCAQVAPILDGTVALPSVSELLAAAQTGALPFPLAGNPLIYGGPR